MSSTPFDQGLPPRAMLRDEAIEQLRTLLAREGIVVEAAEISYLFRKHWLKLSILAHAIHDAKR